MTDFLDIDKQIQLNENRLDFYFSSFEKTLTKFGILIFLYSAMLSYIIPVAIFIINMINRNDWSNMSIVMIVSMVILLTFLIISLTNAIRLILPKEIAYPEMPNFFYNHIKEKYREAGVKDSDLNLSIKKSYLNHLESCLKINTMLYERKSGLFYKSLISVLIAIIPFLIVVSIYHYNNEEIQKVKIENFNELKTK
jgi:hypothetical protein